MYTPTRRRFLAATATTTVGTAVASPAAADNTTTDDEIIYTDADTPSENGDWNQLQSKRTIIYYPHGYYQDAELVREYLTFARQHVTDYFTINPDHEIELYLLPPDADEYGNEVRHETTINNNTYTSNKILVTIPSEHRDYDEDYQDEQVQYDEYDKGEHGIGKAYKHHMTLAYANIVITRVLVNTRGINNYHTVTPRWISEGIPMYIAVYGTEVNEHNAQTQIKSELSEITHNGTARFEYLKNHDAESVGATFIRFVVDTWSWEHVRQYLTTPATTFDNNVQHVFGVTADEFENMWLEWLNANYDAGYTITTPTPTPTTTTTQTTENPFNKTYPEPTTPTQPAAWSNPFLQAASVLTALAVIIGGVVARELDDENHITDDTDTDAAVPDDTTDESDTTNEDE